MASIGLWQLHKAVALSRSMLGTLCLRPWTQNSLSRCPLLQSDGLISGRDVPELNGAILWALPDPVFVCEGYAPLKSHRALQYPTSLLPLSRNEICIGWRPVQEAVRHVLGHFGACEQVKAVLAMRELLQVHVNALRDAMLLLVCYFYVTFYAQFYLFMYYV